MNSTKNYALIAALYLSTFLCLIDLSSVNLALKAIQLQYQSQFSDLQWVIDSYALSMSSLMLAVGAMSQWLGRKSLWMIGVIVFSLGSLLCAMAPSFSMLIIGRIVQGIAGAILIPVALAIIVHHFTDANARAREIGHWSSFSAFALIIGPLLGGLLVQHFGWQSIFWLNLPVGLMTLFIGSLGIEGDPPVSRSSFDYLGLFYSAIAVVTLVYSIIMLQQVHAGYWILLSMLVFVGAVLAFLRQQQRSSHPLIPRHLFKNNLFLRYNAISFLLGFVAYSSLFIFALFYQNQVHLSAIQTGWMIAPQFLAQALVSIGFGRLQQRFSVLLLLRTGLMIAGLALIAMISFRTDSSHVLFMFLSACVGTGVGLIVPGSSVLVMNSIAARDANFAAAILNTLRQLGMTFGIAVLGTLMIWISSISGHIGKNSPHAADLLAFHIVVVCMGALFILAAWRLVKLPER